MNLCENLSCFLFHRLHRNQIKKSNQIFIKERQFFPYLYLIIDSSHFKFIHLPLILATLIWIWMISLGTASNQIYLVTFRPRQLTQASFLKINQTLQIFFFDICNAEMAHGLSSLQKSEFLKLIISFFNYFCSQNWNQCHKMIGKNTHIYFWYFWFKNKRVWAEKIRKIPKT